MDVRIITPYGTLDEVAETLRYGLKMLTGLPDRTILLGAHLLPWGSKILSTCVLYNFEQRESPLLNNQALDLFRRYEVWDYSASNVAWFAARGVRAKHVPIGYVPELKRIQKSPIPDIDVLFYGLVNTRRRRILDDLKAAGLKVHETFNCYGSERDELIGRSKIVLNMHFYDTGIFEMVRCSYLFANQVCVVSEESVDVPTELVGAIALVPYDRLTWMCQHLVDDPKGRRRVATRAHEAFRSCDEADILRRAIWTES